jgi:hypothetical protein
MTASHRILRFTARWTLWSLGGLVLGVVALAALMMAATAAGASEESDVLFALGLALTVGGGLGLAQQRVLRYELGALPWAAWTLTGLLAGALLVFVVTGDDAGVGDAFGAVVHALCLGVALGLTQRAALRGTARASRWPWIALAIWLAAEGAGQAVAAASGADEAGLLAIFATGQLLTGAALACLTAARTRSGEPAPCGSARPACGRCARGGSPPSSG